MLSALAIAMLAVASACPSDNILQDIEAKCPMDCEDCDGLKSEDDEYPPYDYHRHKRMGGWGGSCKCPSGEVYRVGDNMDSCKSLSCEGGEAIVRDDGIFCDMQLESEWQGYSTTCKGAWNAPKENFHVIRGAGGWGGVCQCPDGELFVVGDIYWSGCEALDCFGGKQIEPWTIDNTTGQPFIGKIQNPHDIMCGDILHGPKEDDKGRPIEQADWEMDWRGWGVTCAGALGGVVGDGYFGLGKPFCVKEHLKKHPAGEPGSMPFCDSGHWETHPEGIQGANCNSDECHDFLQEIMDDPDCLHEQYHAFHYDSADYPTKDVHQWAGKGGWGGLCKCPGGQQYYVGDNMDSCGSLACFGGEQVSDCGDTLPPEFQKFEVTCAGHISNTATPEYLIETLVKPLSDGCRITKKDKQGHACKGTALEEKDRLDEVCHPQAFPLDAAKYGAGCTDPVDINALMAASVAQDFAGIREAVSGECQACIADVGDAFPFSNDCGAGLNAVEDPAILIIQKQACCFELGVAKQCDIGARFFAGLIGGHDFSFQLSHCIGTMEFDMGMSAAEHHPDSAHAFGEAYKKCMAGNRAGEADGQHADCQAEAEAAAIAAEPKPEDESSANAVVPTTLAAMAVAMLAY